VIMGSLGVMIGLRVIETETMVKRIKIYNCWYRWAVQRILNINERGCGGWHLRPYFSVFNLHSVIDKLHRSRQIPSKLGLKLIVYKAHLHKSNGEWCVMAMLMPILCTACMQRFMLSLF